MKELKVITEKTDSIRIEDIDLSKHLVIYEVDEILTWNEGNNFYQFIVIDGGERGGTHKTIQEAFDCHGKSLKVYEL